ncbi:MAG: hypothetical protein KGL39_58445 [Patescibacteria group bacterium]|nr:hypothetical protein [Patescibacteria group bacterium]
MAQLSKGDAHTLMMGFVRMQNYLKGEALDMLKLRCTDNQFDLCSKKIKDKEQALRKLFHDTLVRGNLIDPLDNNELVSMK